MMGEYVSGRVSEQELWMRSESVSIGIGFVDRRHPATLVELVARSATIATNTSSTTSTSTSTSTCTSTSTSTSASTSTSTTTTARYYYYYFCYYYK